MQHADGVAHQVTKCNRRCAIGQGGHVQDVVAKGCGHNKDPARAVTATQEVRCRYVREIVPPHGLLECPIAARHEPDPKYVDMEASKFMTWK